jgi:hypothetical protein
MTWDDEPPLKVSDHVFFLLDVFGVPGAVTFLAMICYAEINLILMYCRLP